MGVEKSLSASHFLHAPFVILKLPTTGAEGAPQSDDDGKPWKSDEDELASRWMRDRAYPVALGRGRQKGGR